MSETPEGTALRTLRIEKLPQGSELVLRILRTGTGRFRLRVYVERFRGSDSAGDHIDKLVADASGRMRAAGRGPVVEAAIAELATIRSEVHAAADAAVRLVDKVMAFADLALDIALFSADNMAAAASKMLDAGAGKRL